MSQFYLVKFNSKIKGLLVSRPEPSETFRALRSMLPYFEPPLVDFERYRDKRKLKIKKGDNLLTLEKLTIY